MARILKVLFSHFANRPTCETGLEMSLKLPFCRTCHWRGLLLDILKILPSGWRHIQWYEKKQKAPISFNEVMLCLQTDRERVGFGKPIVDFLHLNCIFQSRNVIVLPTYPTSMCFELFKSQIQFNLNSHVLHIEYSSFHIGTLFLKGSKQRMAETCK